MINRVIAGSDGLRTGIHVCRGNWSRQEEVLLAGDYRPLAQAFAQMNVQQYVLEYATPRAGEIAVVGSVLNGKEIGLGVVNPRTDEVEPVAQIVARAEAALQFYRPEQIFLNPDCGFGCFANRCVNDEATAVGKLTNIVAASRVLREKYA